MRQPLPWGLGTANSGELTALEHFSIQPRSMACSTQECSTCCCRLGTPKLRGDGRTASGFNGTAMSTLPGRSGTPRGSAKTVGWRLTSRSTRCCSGFGVGVAAEASGRTIIIIGVSSVTRDRASAAVTTSTEVVSNSPSPTTDRNESELPTADAPREKDLAGTGAQPEAKPRAAAPSLNDMCALYRIRKSVPRRTSTRVGKGITCRSTERCSSDGPRNTGASRIARDTCTVRLSANSTGTLTALATMSAQTVGFRVSHSELIAESVAPVSTKTRMVLAPNCPVSIIRLGDSRMENTRCPPHEAAVVLCPTNVPGSREPRKRTTSASVGVDNGRLASSIGSPRS